MKEVFSSHRLVAAEIIKNKQTNGTKQFRNNQTQDYRVNLNIYIVFSAAHTRMFNILVFGNLLYGLQAKCLWCCLVSTRC